ncbi:CGNR zinc finger domain-containing protein [Kitasatospora sp. McL0602]|uniref:CGNR zinc finger domain-containing protein n=1 Tax=Kitasatospora sp. McL0602 TaxID=3439530 RepID=UPI003F8BF205
MEFVFVSGDPALDFAGTVQHRRSEPVDLVTTPDGLSAWVAASGLVDNPAAATAADLAAALRLREAVYRMALAAATGAPYDDADRELLNGAAAGAPITTELLADRSLRHTGSVRAVLATLARTAVELLAGPSAEAVKECAGQRCTRLYVDRSRRGSRRWCDMSVCGNRAKAAAFRERHPVP